MFLSFKRVVKTGFVNFWRNGFVSVSSVVVMTITLFVIGSLIFLNALLRSSLDLLKDKVDINAYFDTSVPEDSILAVEKALKALPEVKSVTYTSRDEALAQFKERRKNDTIALQALQELPDNPLRASLAIKAKDPNKDFDLISKFLSTDQTTLSPDGSSLVAKVNWNDNKGAIERLTKVMRGIELFGLALSTALLAASIVIVFNTIRMAIYVSREEIMVMRLVGASDAYIRGPFVIEGAMYGVVAGLIALVAFYPLTFWLGPSTQQFFGDINIFVYYTTHFGQIFLTIMGTGIFLGALSSFLAVKKHLRT